MPKTPSTPTYPVQAPPDDQMPADDQSAPALLGGEPAGPENGGASGDPGTSGDQSAQREWRLAWLKESATVLIALAIVAVSLIMLISNFFGVSERSVTAGDVANATLLAEQQRAHQDAVKERDNIINVMIGVLGVVTGYFFGRAPAERRAQKAEESAQNNAQAARTAQGERDAAKYKVDDVRQTLGNVMGTGRTPALLGGNVPSEAVAELRSLQRRLDRTT